jgi:hypothetical protein
MSPVRYDARAAAGEWSSRLRQSTKVYELRTRLRFGVRSVRLIALENISKARERYQAAGISDNPVLDDRERQGASLLDSRGFASRDRLPIQ